MKKFLFISDFDGTMTSQDFFLQIMYRYQHNRVFSNNWKSGFDLLSDVFDSINLSESDLQREIEYIPLDPYFVNTVKLVRKYGGDFLILSAGCKYYIERKDTVITPDADDISLLLRQSSTTDSTWEKSICLGAEWEDLDAKLMADVVSDGLKSGRLQNKYNTPEWLLGHLNLTDAPYIKNGAMALFVDMDNAGRFLPQNRVRIQVMLGGKTAAKYEDSTTLVGNMLGLLNDVHDYFGYVFFYSGNGAELMENTFDLHRVNCSTREG